MYAGLITTIQSIEKHPNADRLLIAHVAGENVIVANNYKVGDIGIFFPSGGTLSHEFCMKNRLYRKNPDTGEPMGGYMEENRRVRAQKIRGTISNGLFLPLNCLDYTGVNLATIEISSEINSLNGHEICHKYIRPKLEQQSPSQGDKKGVRRHWWQFWKPRKRHRDYTDLPMFYEIGDTPRLFSNLHAIEIGDILIVTEKLHGTSGRTGKFVQVESGWKAKIKKFFGMPPGKKEIVVNGTRRTILNKYSMYNEHEYRHIAAATLGDLYKPNRIIYYEIVGYDTRGVPIMYEHDASGLPEIAEKYGERIVYHYGCKPREHDVYVYKIIDHDENNEPYEMPFWDMKALCDKHGIKTVPILLEYHIESEEDKTELSNVIKCVADGDSVLANHLREGVCVTVSRNGQNRRTYKHKGETFCLLEDIVPYDFEDEN